jgi:hypothetical protein
MSNKGVDNGSPSEELASRATLYKTLSAEQQDSSGFIHTDKCDSLLFSALLAVARDEAINLPAARGVSGQWYRRPSQDCFALGESKSTISRDMFMGVLLYAAYFKDAALINQIWRYGSDNNWNMGQGVDTETEIGRTIWTPSLIGLAAQIRKTITGKTVAAIHLPGIYSTVEGYRSHLTMLNIVATYRANAEISGTQVDAIKTIRNASPGNALAQALYAKFISGDYSMATALLLAKFPSDRLPTTDDWCEEWVVQRSDSESSISTPCEGSHTHSGGDFLFTAAIIMNKL